MECDIKMAAVDIDGTFVRSDYSYDVPRFRRIFSRMEAVGCRFVAASGNQYFQLRDLFPDCAGKMGFVAENGAYVRDRDELIFTAQIPKGTADAVIDVCRAYPDISTVVCGLESAYCQRGTVSRDFYNLTGIYCHRLMWVDDFKEIKDQILKFALTVPEEKIDHYCAMFRGRLEGKLEVTTSGHGAIDLIVPGCHKASGLRRLAERWGISPEQCAAFGDGGNDIEMLDYCGYSYAMDNAPGNVKRAAGAVCPSNEEDGVLVTLEKLLGMPGRDTASPEGQRTAENE